MKTQMKTHTHNQVAKTHQRNYAYDIAKLWLGKKHIMSKQAKTLNEIELRRVLDYISTRKHASRNRALLLITHLAGMRVGEVSSLRYRDVVDAAGKIKSEIFLKPEQTKGRHSRTVFISERLQRELQKYVKSVPNLTPDAKFFYTQKKGNHGFSANTLTQHFHYLYKRAGLEGCSSHSGRRTFATNIAARGVSVRALMKLLGHRSVSTTILYVDANDQMLRNAVELAF